MFVAALWAVWPIARTHAAVDPVTETSIRAENGDAVAQYTLGTMYQGGRGVAQDYAEAVKWYRKSADQGYAPAEARLAGMYRGGYGGLPQDDAQADDWDHKAAAQGNVEAKFAIVLAKLIPRSFVLGLSPAYRNGIFFGFIAIAVIIYCSTFVFSAAFILNNFTNIFDKFRTAYGLYCKISAMYIICLIVLISLVFVFHNINMPTVLVLFCTGFVGLAGKVIKHPRIGSIGYARSGVIFGGLSVWLVVLSTILFSGCEALLKAFV